MHRSLAFVLTGFTLALTPPALAFCPKSPDDARAGFQIGFADGSTTIVTLLDTGVTREETLFNDGSDEGELALALHGYLVTNLNLTQGGVSQPFGGYERGFLPSTLAALPLAPGETLVVEAIETMDGEALPLTQVLTAGPDEKALIGSCILTVRKIRVELDPAYGDDVDHFIYFPDLQVGIYAGSTGGGLPPLMLHPASIRPAG